MNSYCCKTKLVEGQGAISALGQIGAQRLMVVSDPFFVKNGAASRLAATTGAEHTCIYSELTPDPSVRQVAKGTAQLKAFSPDTVIALGGGSAMDCAKAMVYFSGLSVYVVAIPTTSGSGSEVTDFAVLTHEGQKHPLVDPRLRPDMAILDSDLLEKLPTGLIAECGFDAISHAVESYVAGGCNPITQALAGDAFRMAMESLPLSWQGQLSARAPMHMASSMAAMAFTQSGLGLCHALSHTLGGLFHLPHGRLNAILLPAVIGINSQAAGGSYARLAQRAGLGGAAACVGVKNLQNSLIRLRKQLQLPGSLSQAGVAPCQLQALKDRIVAGTLEDPCCATNPAAVTADLICRVLKEVAGDG